MGCFRANWSNILSYILLKQKDDLVMSLHCHYVDQEDMSMHIWIRISFHTKHILKLELHVSLNISISWQKRIEKKLYNNLVLHHPIIIDCNITMFFSLTFSSLWAKEKGAGSGKWEVGSGTIKSNSQLLWKWKTLIRFILDYKKSW